MNKQQYEKLLNIAIENGADFAEIYCEITRNNTISLLDKKIDKIDELIVQKTPNSILWCGRFLDWKHPDDVIEIANMLKKENN